MGTAAAVLAVAISAAFVGAADASVLFTDGFAADSNGQNYLNFNDFSNWTVSGGAVDLVNQSNGYNINDCPGACVDLAGSPGPGEITSKAISFAGGAPVTVSFMVSGNQRDLDTDGFYAAVNFLPANDGVANFISGPAGFNTGYLDMLNGTPWTESIVGDRSYITYSYWFIADHSGAFTMTFGAQNTPNNNIGPLLDNVSVTGAPGVPEPATWALMIGGFGLAGATLRRRRAVTA
jgi:hypothetical protein